MLTDNTILLPCLKEPAWPGHDGTVARPLWAGAPSAFMPWVSFGYDHPHTFEFLGTHKLEELKMNAEQVERQALQNLAMRKATWQPLNARLGLFKKLKMLVCADDFLAAERILDPGFMLIAQKRLGAKGLIAGVPRRGLLLVTDGEGGLSRIEPFAAMIAAQFRDGESAPISPIAFALKDGAIVATLDTVAEAVMKSSSAGQAEEDGGEIETDDPHAPYVNTMVIKNDQGQRELMIMAGGDEFESLARGVVSELAACLSKYVGTPEFSGKVTVFILAMTPENVRAEIPRLEAHLQGILGDMGAAAGDTPIQLKVEIQEGKAPFLA